MDLPDGIDLITFTDANHHLIESLIGESLQEGFEFVRRTFDDWKRGANRFSLPGEGLWGLVAGTELIGIGGLNIDPYLADAGIGRVRHLYVHLDYRRTGYATMLMHTIIGRARQHFHTLRLYTANAAASSFYERLGFVRVVGDRVSHVMEF